MTTNGILLDFSVERGRVLQDFKTAGYTPRHAEDAMRNGLSVITATLADRDCRFLADNIILDLASKELDRLYARDSEYSELCYVNAKAIMEVFLSQARYFGLFGYGRGLATATQSTDYFPYLAEGMRPNGLVILREIPE